MFKKLKARYEKWNDWRKYFADCSMLYKIQVLLGLSHSVSFESWAVLKKEDKTI